MTIGAWVLLASVLLAAAYGGWRVLTDGRVRRAAPVAASVPGDEAQASPSLLAGTAYAGSLGDHRTLLQFSSAFCAPCRATRQVLARVTEAHPGVVHLDVDAEQHLDLVRRLGIMRTPTTLVLDGDGREVARAAGVPRADQVVAALA